MQRKKRVTKSLLGDSDSEGKRNKRSRDRKPYKVGENYCQISTWGVPDYQYKNTNLTYVGRLDLFCMESYRNHIWLLLVKV